MVWEEGGGRIGRGSEHRFVLCVQYCEFCEFGSDQGEADLNREDGLHVCLSPSYSGYDWRNWCDPTRLDMT